MAVLEIADVADLVRLAEKSHVGIVAAQRWFLTAALGELANRTAVSRALGCS